MNASSSLAIPGPTICVDANTRPVVMRENSLCAVQRERQTFAIALNRPLTVWLATTPART